MILSFSKVGTSVIRLRNPHQAVLGVACVCSSSAWETYVWIPVLGCSGNHVPEPAAALFLDFLASMPESKAQGPGARQPGSPLPASLLVPFSRQLGPAVQPLGTLVPMHLGALAKPSSLPKMPISVRSAPVSARESSAKVSPCQVFL